jgi:DNA polymerase
MGADEIIAERASNLLVAEEQKKVEPRAQPAAPARPASRLDPGERPIRSSSSDPPIGDAAAIAASCSSLAELAAALRRFDACPLQRTATNLVFADGNPQARVMFIGEAPGREEDEQGKPFVGRSGQLLDRMLAAIGLSRHSAEPASSAYITNVIYWRPPGNRKPTEAETLMCMPFMLRSIELARPEFILCLGATPTQRLLGLTDGILKTRGAWRDFRGKPVLPTLHPAYLLRQPAQKRLAWRDLLSLKRKLIA